MSTITGNPAADAIIDVAGGVAAILNIAGIAALVWFKTQYKKVLAEHKHQLDLKFAAREAELRVTTEKEVALLRADLEKVTAEHQVQFASVYAKREEMLGKLHKELTATLNACWAASRPGATELSAEFQKRIAGMHAHMDEAALYFPEEFCERWHERTFELHRTLDLFLTARRVQTADLRRDLAENRQAFEKHHEAFKAMREELRNEMRKWLGTASK